MISGAIFDLDGTLLDSNPCWAEADATFLSRRGLALTAPVQRAIETLTTAEGARYLKAHFALPDAPDAIEAEIGALLAGSYCHTAPLKPGVADFLAGMQAKGIKMAVATVTRKAWAEAALMRLDIQRYFAAVLEAGGGKQTPEVYFGAVHVLGTKPDRTLVFEDAPYALETARRAGFWTVGVADAAVPRARQREYAAFYLEGWRLDVLETQLAEKSLHLGA